MRKCSVCGKVISDFSSECPYCRSDLSSPSYDVESLEKKAYYTNRTIKKHVLISLILSLVILLVFGGPIPLIEIYFGPYSLMGYIEFAIELACCTYGTLNMIKNKTIKNKLIMVLAAVCGLFFAVYQSFRIPRMYGMNSFILYRPWTPSLLKIAVLLTYVLKGCLLFIAIIDLWYLILYRMKKSSE